ncbi:MAG: polymer-forming cytoskeletal protein [Pseudomonadales bacterium]|nr:polymer-forming cytoskeletal protein [Pseudomonadales bacterium]
MIDRTIITTLILSACSIAIPPKQAQAAELLGGVQVLIGPEEVIDEDVYAFAGRVLVEGTINGDLVAAGENIEITGSVNGDLIVAGRAISISGTVEDDIRAAGAELQFSSGIGGDLITAGNEIIIETEVVVGEDVVAGGNSVVSRGIVEGDMELNAVEANIIGTVQGNVQATVEEDLILGPEASIGGALTYTSPNEVMMNPGSTVLGEITLQPPEIEIFGNAYPISTFIEIVRTFIDQSKWFLSTLLAGFLLLALFPATSHNVVATLRQSPWRSLGMGVLVLALVPLVLLLSMIAILSILGSSAFPIIAVPGIVYAGLLLLAKPLVAVAVGGYVAEFSRGNEQSSPRTGLVIGAALLAVLGCFPYVDSIVGWLTLLFGFGMWLLFFHRNYREARAAHSA